MEYELKIKQNGRNYNQYNINNENYIGVQKNEPFEIYFKNYTYNKVQVRLSLDGTDIITGEPTSTSPKGKMWIVKPYGEMTLKAWPETNSGGAAFVFTDPEKGVAVNTHGIKAGLGLIGAAVYIENQSYYQQYTYNTSGTSFPIRYAGWPARGGNGLLRSQSQSLKGLGSTAIPTLDTISYNSATTGTKSVSDALSDSFANIDESVSVGAGDFTQQTITTEAALVKPVLYDVIQVRYVSWAKLEKMLNKAVAKPIKEEKRINLKNVPKTKVEHQRFV